MLNANKTTFTYGAHSVTLETGEIARQAGGAVIVNMEETVVLATVVAAKEARPGQDFFRRRNGVVARAAQRHGNGSGGYGDFRRRIQTVLPHDFFALRLGFQQGRDVVLKGCGDA